MLVGKGPKNGGLKAFQAKMAAKKAEMAMHRRQLAMKRNGGKLPAGFKQAVQMGSAGKQAGIATHDMEDASTKEPEHHFSIDLKTNKTFYLTPDGLMQFYDPTIKMNQGPAVQQSFQKDDDGNYYMYVADPDSLDKNNPDVIRQFYNDQGHPIEAPTYDFTSTWVNMNGINLFIVTNITGHQDYMVNEESQFVLFNRTTGRASYTAIQPWIVDYNNKTFLLSLGGLRLYGV